MSIKNSATLVAIAKNEGPYIAEWIAYNFAIGFDKIVIFVNDSADDMLARIEHAEKKQTSLSHVIWPAREGISPQISAYNFALKNVDSDWICFLDIDEFLVPFRDGGLKPFLARVPDDVASVHINWRNFGSSGLTDANYRLVTEAFTRCALPQWGNHFHFKSIARRSLVTDVHIHDIGTSAGRRVLSDFSEFGMPYRGIADRIVYEGIQINHYQAKTFPEFCARMKRGDANFAMSEPREHSRDRFNELDRNEAEDISIAQFRDALAAMLSQITKHP
ncbi:glycosyltransferase family 2 protein [uncultured Methylobacterium sp.]|jgi:glycosyltransferase involved in cell wall biosynthesis|uniref:glycosyltransferase family 2 protein n=1 Tax=uncultured Methylobacterium sp. TaxID=157278 RepID=UPI0026022938|nr:glycosyltransferase family 2 protein [uncultured Methylobacterium sp.]